VLLAGCGGSSARTGAITRGRLVAAIDKTRAIGSAHVVEAFSLVSPQGDVHATVSGDANFASNADCPRCGNVYVLACAGHGADAGIPESGVAGSNPCQW
jgi:hypothetical protein